VTFFIDKEVALASTEFLELAEDRINSFDVFTVEDDALIAQVIAIGNHCINSSRNSQDQIFMMPARGSSTVAAAVEATMNPIHIPV
jgi:hypothetical protein